MLKSLKKKMKDQAGLTLIELLVVIVILGIIAAVAIPMVMSQRDEAQEKTDAQNLAVVQDAVHRYYTVEGDWPDSTGDLDPTYIKEVPGKCADGETDTNYAIGNDGNVTSGCGQTATPVQQNPTTDGNEND